MAAARTLKAVLGSHHAYQRNTQPVEPSRGPPLCEDWVPRAEKGLECRTTSSGTRCLTHGAQWRFTEGEGGGGGAYSRMSGKLLSSLGRKMQ